jgi:hypothetical protein
MCANSNFLTANRVRAGFSSALVVWDGSDNQSDMVGSGVYIYRMETGAIFEARKMVRLP